jgi:hypothetical protein
VKFAPLLLRRAKRGAVSDGRAPATAAQLMPALQLLVDDLQVQVRFAFFDGLELGRADPEHELAEAEVAALATGIAARVPRAAALALMQPILAMQRAEGPTSLADLLYGQEQEMHG